eukprot:TRINITY_DN67502_c0_g1_i1.p1 TRINITY_DN67502_c0_g1~~TRINITY_DN67502_c0_g1_i1.p1  ORF type:complete len:379 (-),score=54.02 TRINITY_DN67502_c0_g1_i1:274-1326(-)
MCIDMEEGLKPVMLSFVIETPPNQLKTLAGLAELLEEAHRGKSNAKDRQLFHQALQQAKVISSNSAFMGMLKRQDEIRSTDAALAAELKPPLQQNQDQPSLTPRRRKRRFSRQNSPISELPRHLQSQTGRDLELIQENDGEQPPSFIAQHDEDKFSDESNLSSHAVGIQQSPGADADEPQASSHQDHQLSTGLPLMQAGNETAKGHIKASEADEAFAEHVPLPTPIPLLASKNLEPDLPPSFSADKLWGVAASGASMCKGNDADVALHTTKDFSNSSRISGGEEPAGCTGFLPSLLSGGSSATVPLDITSKVPPHSPAAPQSKSSVIRTAMRKHQSSGSEENPPACLRSE